VPEEVYSTWQPKKVMETLQEYDPFVMENYELRIWSEKPDGSRDKLILTEGHTNLRFEVLKKHYNKLSFFLHVPTLKQQKNKGAEVQDLKSYLETILPEISAAAANTFDSNLAEVAQSVCRECGQPILRNVESLKNNPVAICKNENCKAEYDVKVTEKGKTLWKLRQLDFACPKCKKKNYFGRHFLKEGQVINCFECSSKYILNCPWYLADRDEDKT